VNSRTNVPPGTAPASSQIPRQPPHLPAALSQLLAQTRPLEEISHEDLTYILCLARQKGTGQLFSGDFRIQPLEDGGNVAEVFFRESLIRGLRVQALEIAPPEGTKVMCIFGCRPTCHLSNVRGAREHQIPKLSKGGVGACPKFANPLKCRNRDDFRRRRRLDANPLVVCYREDLEGHWVTQLHSLGRTLLQYAHEFLKIRDEDMVALWNYHHPIKCSKK
jgi:hypothetical protein